MNERAIIQDIIHSKFGRVETYRFSTNEEYPALVQRIQIPAYSAGQCRLSIVAAGTEDNTIDYFVKEITVPFSKAGMLTLGTSTTDILQSSAGAIEDAGVTVSEDEGDLLLTITGQDNLIVNWDIHSVLHIVQVPEILL